MASPHSAEQDTAAPPDPAEAEAAIRAVDARIVLVAPRLLRRVIRVHRRLPALTLRVPHRKAYVLPRRDLLAIVDADELHLSADSSAEVILLPRVAGGWLGGLGLPEALRHHWRLIYHARIHLALERLSAAEAEGRLDALGETAEAEIRHVLAHERLLLPPADRRALYIEFAAVWCELRHFQPSLLPAYFPTIFAAATVEGPLATEIDEAFLAAARPAGAADAIDRRPPPSEFDDEPGADDDEPAAVREPSPRRFGRWIARAERAEAKGNDVRGAICRVVARRYADRPRKQRGAIRAGIRRLLHRLETALAMPQPLDDRWTPPLADLVDRAARGYWTVEARLLYDVQKVCIDHERGVWKVDVVEWLLSLGQRPLRRPLPSQREVLMAKHLRSAAARLGAVRLADEHRHGLAELLQSGLERVEESVRRHFRPQIAAALDAVGLAPANLPERVARHKLVEELLDRVAERGYLNFGELRDALSRNQLKLPDTAADDLGAGDALLRADRKLGVALDGVYRRGEFYLRWMQQLTALAFGTPLGRLLTRYAAVPFGGAYVLLAGAEHLAEAVHYEQLPIRTPLNVALLGGLLLGLIDVEPFRRAVGRLLARVARGLRLLAVDLPRWIYSLAPVRALIESRIVAAAMRFVVKPAAATAAVWWLLGRVEPLPAGEALPVLFVLMALVLNSRLGRDLEELALDGALQGWRRLGLPILTGAFYLILDVFKGIVEQVERFLYTVDEWLRFRSGEGRAALIAKAALGFVWFFLTYVVRFAINLLIEPQVNPIKHFPVVTVSHKLLLPLIPSLAHVLSLTLETGLAYTVATAIIFGIPGIFGFLVWELKENWRLYAANRPRTLRPSIVGHHGETLRRLLKPGFHSGTVPKRFAKLRRAERKGRRKASRRHRAVLRQVEAQVARFVERDLLAYVGACGAAAAAWRVARVRLATQWIAVELAAEGEPPATLAFYVAGGWLVGERAVELPAAWSPVDRQAADLAFAGLWQAAGADIDRGDLDRRFPPPAAWRLAVGELRVRPTADAEASYNLTEEVAVPRIVRGPVTAALPILSTADVLVRRREVLWSEWVARWDQSCGKSAPEAQPSQTA